MPKGTDAAKMKGRLLPHLDVDLSDQIPTMILLAASQIVAIMRMNPAKAGSSFTTSVRKNMKKR